MIVGTKRSIVFAAALLLVPTGAESRRAPAPASTPQANPCTTIAVQLLDTLDTAKQHAGDVFRFQTIGTVVTPENTTVPRSAVGYGIVSFASPAGAHGRSGNLIIETRYVTVPGHAPLQVAIDSNASSAVANGSTGNLSGGVSLVPLPFVGTAVGAFNYLHPGKNAIVPAGARFVVVPVGNLATTKRCSF